MKILSTYEIYGLQIKIASPEDEVDFNYLCNLAVAEHIYEKPEWTFYKLLNNERQYIRHMAALMQDDVIYGLGIVWDYAQRVSDKGLVEDVATLLDYGFLQYAVGVYVSPHQRNNKIGSIIVNNTMTSFGKPVFCNGHTTEQQSFWMSETVDKTHLKFMLFDNNSAKHTFERKDNEFFD